MGMMMEKAGILIYSSYKYCSAYAVKFQHYCTLFLEE